MGERLREDQRQQSPHNSDPGAHAKELSQLFEQHNRTLVAFLMARLGNEAEAKEVAQEAYVRVLQLNQPGAVSFLRAYLFRTAANIAVDRIRHRIRVERLDQVFDDDDLTNQLGPDRDALANEDLMIVRQALLELPASYRRAFLLNRFEELNTEEIGKMLGIKSTQTRLYLRRAMAYCRLRMEGFTESEARERVFS